MKVYNKIADIRAQIKQLKKAERSIGFVPTMGYLHEGHLSLIKSAVQENDIVIISIFINPKQFGPNEDFAKYPRDIEKDLALISEATGHIVFIPEIEEIYPIGFQSYVEVKELTANLCGASRPDHFVGVTTIVNKLFNIVNPDRAYFGQKDAQQALVIKRMVRDLNIDVEVIICPIVREQDGLARSSRNVYLSIDERQQALSLSKALFEAKDAIVNGERDIFRLKELIKSMIKDMPLANIDYIQIVDVDSLKELQKINSKALIALAVKFGNTRLIDNILVEV